MKKIWNWVKNNPNRAMFLVPILLVAIISISHVVSFYDMANPHNWAIYLSIAIEVGAITALVAATNRIKGGIWFMFGLVTFVQLLGNIFYSYKEIDPNGDLFKSWVELTGPVWELFGTEQTDVVGLKRWLAFLEGGLLPLISLTSLHFFVKYEKKEDKLTENNENKEDAEKPIEEVIEEIEIEEPIEEPIEEVIEEVEVEEEPVGEAVEEFEIEEEPVEEVYEITEEEFEEALENIEESLKEASEKSEEEPIEEIQKQEELKEDFEQFVQRKKRKLEEDRKVFLPLLDLFFANGKVEKGNVMPTYPEFKNIVVASKPGLQFTDDNIKMFLTLCNYLNITELSDNIRKAKVDYEEAKAVLNKYLSLDESGGNQDNQPKDWWNKK
jgi:hypothetical protein